LFSFAYRTCCVDHRQSVTPQGVLFADDLIRFKPKELRGFFDLMQPGAVLFFPLFNRKNSSAKASELGEFLLDRL
jgi:hypothetical protein